MPDLLLCFTGITENEELKFREFIKAANVVYLDDEVVNSAIQVCKTYKNKLPYAIIAATALVNNFTIIKRFRQN